MTIRVGSPPLSFYAVQGAVVCAVLERAGYATEHVMAFHDEIYPRLGSGEIDVFCATWLPSAHATLWSPIEERAVKLGCLFRGGGFYIAASPRLAQDGARCILDLAQFDAVERAVVSVGSGGATLTSRARNALQVHGLDTAGFHVHAVPEKDWFEWIKNGTEKGRRFAAAVWRPSFVNATTDLALLSDPENAMGPQDDGWIAANRDFLRTAPNALKHLLAGLQLEIETIEALDIEVTIRSRHPPDVAIDWLAANAECIDKLISESLLAADLQV
ncbi:glycine betaine ABC transporter substrate-binding protein [Roseobacter sp. EG26]|uniref:glycine betaine ABC transporter substrate-binding protein n=1 Tax=Roseobacter sp. EG26 TaxID=3412477 RepID=UPI003CE5B642